MARRYKQLSDAAPWHRLRMDRADLPEQDRRQHVVHHSAAINIVGVFRISHAVRELDTSAGRIADRADGNSFRNRRCLADWLR